MTGRVYYNEFDPGAARWLRELMHENLIPPGVVDERSIHEVRACDLRGFVQVHFCAGIGVWPHALRRAGWDDARPVGTGSFPCQPFSAAGKGGGFSDRRHIWGEGYRLIRAARAEGQPWANVLFGEQAATAGAWIDLVRSDLEGLGHAFASVDLPAAGFGGAHIRQRFYWVADADNAERWSDLAPRHDGDRPHAGRVEGAGDAAERGAAGGVADGDRWRQSQLAQRDGGALGGAGASSLGGDARRRGDVRWVGHAESGWWVGDGRAISAASASDQGAPSDQGYGHAYRYSGPTCDWLACRDGVWRPVESGTFPLADEDPGRVGRLRGYGNALDAEVAANFIAAYREAAGEGRVRLARAA